MASVDIQSHNRVRDLLGRRFGDVIFTKIDTITINIEGTTTQRHGMYVARINRDSTCHCLAIALCAPGNEPSKKKLKDIAWTQLHLRTYNNPENLYDKINADWEKMGEPQHLSVDMLEEPKFVMTKDGKKVKNPQYYPILDLPLEQYTSDEEGREITYISEDKTVLVTCRAHDVDEDNLGGQELPSDTTLMPALEMFNTVIWFPATLADALATNIPIRGTKRNEDSKRVFKHIAHRK